VDIQSKSENSFISNFTSSDLWTGGALISESDSWQWEGGAPWSWTGWDDELPVDVVEGCLSVQPGGIWTPVDCNTLHSAVCEIKGEEGDSLDIVTDTENREPDSTSRPARTCNN